MNTKAARRPRQPSSDVTDELTLGQREELRALEEKPDNEIDLSDIPEVLDWSGAERGKFYRPIKQQITLRVDADVLAWFKSQTPKGYHSAINAALRHHVIKSIKVR